MWWHIQARAQPVSLLGPRLHSLGDSRQALSALSFVGKRGGLSLEEGAQPLPMGTGIPSAMFLSPS